MKHNLNYQLGEIILYKKQIPISTRIETDFLNDTALTEFPNYDSPLPLLLPRIAINNELAKKKITINNNKIYYIRSSFINHFIKLTEFTSFDDYLQKFSSKSRATLKRKVKKALKNDFIVKIYQKEIEVDEFHTHACTVGRNTYQNKLFNASLPEDIRYKNKIKEQAKNDLFLGLVLFKESKPCAYLYIPIINDSYQYEYLGYIQEYSKFSPGTVLQYFALENIYNDKPKASYFDFTEGDGAHKSFFASHNKLCCNALILPNTFLSKFWVSLQVILDDFSSFIGNTLERFNLKNKLKKIIRKV
ncbi:MAG: hypothetical protein ACJARX_000366 [Psychroserpens sp.]|jgi:hypothetical protein|uniref:GNAT family N-acetyltransferase n=1 Tax=Colwellia sp. KU-HH00111 TaxID=3127652 RepID=UPI00336563CE